MYLPRFQYKQGYSRKGAAYFGLGRFQEAVDSYKEGLKLDPSNAQLKKGLEDAESQLDEGLGGGIVTITIIILLCCLNVSP